jgi:serine/threonine protein kinase
VSTFSHPQPGVVIDGFRLETRLHQGSMSTLWRVTAEGRRGAFAMKIPLLRDYDDPAAIVGFEVEQMILPTLSGAHVPRFVAAGDFSTQPYIVVELIEGASLRPRLDEAPLPAIEVAALGARIATALHDIHSQHVIHLDVKPSNVMFRESGEAVLIDFGLSRHDRLPDLLAEEFRLPMGTAPYIAP